MKSVRGTAFNIASTVIGKITFKNNILIQDKILVCEKAPKVLFGVKALILKSKPDKVLDIPTLVVDTCIFNEGDIVSITSDGNCSVIWEVKSPHNAFYVTDICNSRCIMCPQPMDENCGCYFGECLKMTNLIDFKSVQSVGITGGEPTLNVPELAVLIKKIKTKSPDMQLHILTNGRIFADEKKLSILNSVKKNNITYGIPLYSDVPDEHDFLVGVKGAFNETARGLYNLAKTKQPVEIRIVILKQNYKKLESMVEFIWRNFPFVVHVALMGAEYTGLAKDNFEKVFIDPLDYKEEVYAAIKQLVRCNIVASIYNIPLCLLDERVWDFSKDSISTWKKGYLEKCVECEVKAKCCGLFETSFTQSKNISPVKDQNIVEKSLSHR